nr:DUF3572 domain-containing protein [Maritimibacter sp. DP1N21-5]
MTRDRAETVALTALGWLVGNDELLPVFLGATGGDAGSLRRAAEDDQALGAVLDFLTMDDNWVVALCDATGLDYRDPLAARMVLSGGEMHWT